jgi:hypothetical protein
MQLFETFNWCFDILATVLASFPKIGYFFQSSEAVFLVVRKQPFYERAVSYLDRSMHRSLWVYVTHNSFIEGSHTTKNMASGHSAPF